jgi:hypothetical protein
MRRCVYARRPLTYHGAGTARSHPPSTTCRVKIVSPLPENLVALNNSTNLACIVRLHHYPLTNQNLGKGKKGYVHFIPSSSVITEAVRSETVPSPGFEFVFEILRKRIAITPAPAPGDCFNLTDQTGFAIGIRFRAFGNLYRGGRLHAYTPQNALLISI